MHQTIQVDVLATSEATVVEVRGGTYLETNPALVAQGAAKKHPNDEHDAEVGHALAMSRALKALAESYEKRAWERINHPRTYRFADGGYVTSIDPTSATWTGKFDHEWLDKVFGKNARR
jgi:hypothetical protein